MLKPWPENSIPIVAGRLDDPSRIEIPGSVAQVCFNCAATLMVSPSTMKLARPFHRFVCKDCQSQYVAAQGYQPEALPFTSEQQREFRQHGHRDN